MLKRLIIASLIMLCGCANTTMVQPKTNVEAPATAWKVVSGEHYSFSVPESFIDVKKPTEELIDYSYVSPDHFLVVSTATDTSTDPIELYAMGLAMAMEEGGAALVDHRMGRWAGMKAILLIVGVARRFIVMHYLAKDDKNNVYMMSCALSPLFLKQYAPVCAAISRTFILLPQSQ